jgi:hypothetical protein
MGLFQSKPPVPQTSPTLEKLITCFRATIPMTDHEDDPKTACDIVALIEKKMMDFDPSSTFRGTLSVGRYAFYSLNGCFEKFDIQKVCQNTWGDPVTFDIDDVKPYLLAFVMSVHHKQWYPVFKALLNISDVSLGDKIFGVTFFDLYLMGKHDSLHDRKVTKAIFKNVVIYKLNTILYDPLWYLIKENMYDMMEDILEVSEWKTAMKDNYLIELNKIKDREKFIQLLVSHRNTVFDVIFDETCFTNAIRLKNDVYFNYYLLNFDIIPKFSGNRILHALFANQFFHTNVVKNVINEAKKKNIDVVNLKDKKGYTPLWILCDQLTVENYKKSVWWNAIIQLLIEAGADINYKLGEKSLASVLIDKSLYGLTSKMVDWQRSVDKKASTQQTQQVIPII